MSEADELSALITAARGEIDAAAQLDELDEIRVRLLGKKGQLTAQLTNISSLPPAERPGAGQAINAAKQELAGAIEARRETLQNAAFDKALEHAPAPYWAHDGVHPSMAGAQLMAETWLRTVG